MTNLMHWRLLVAIADTGSVSSAAARCGITQSGASQAISQLEDMLGIRILVRDRRKTTVTAIGEPVIERARRMLAEWDSIKALADASRGMHTGRIKLATFPSVFTKLLPGLLQSFREQHPGVEIIALDGTDEEIETWLAAGTIDVGVVMNPAAGSDAFVLGRDAWVAVVPTAHPLARRSSSVAIALEMLIDQPFVVATGGCHLNGQRLVESEGFALSDVRISVRDWPTAFELIRDGVGLSVVPESMLPGNQQGLRIFRLDRPIYREFGLISAEAARGAPVVQAFFEHIRKSMLPGPRGSRGAVGTVSRVSEATS
ncbi:LysR family transcriptional regulator [Paraburkholderia sp. ZP32-5]|uniref:LysR family transcriptional regulator n=1 Tax=Paraburkholderia sp. ZP32-5 TaxID=2883245 RepID=UPI001F44973F|nr:LysR family transcriptional regulator [Paraburkholderia sp. ZP32-5]